MAAQRRLRAVVKFLQGTRFSVEMLQCRLRRWPSAADI